MHMSTHGPRTGGVWVGRCRPGLGRKHAILSRHHRDIMTSDCHHGTAMTSRHHCDGTTFRPPSVHVSVWLDGGGEDARQSLLQFCGDLCRVSLSGVHVDLGGEQARGTAQ